jgi:hypothetical protein
MAPERPLLFRREYPVPEDDDYVVIGPYLKPENQALAEYPKGTTCWYVIVKWRGLELFIAGDTRRAALTAAAEKILELSRLDG